MEAPNPLEPFWLCSLCEEPDNLVKSHRKCSALTGVLFRISLSRINRFHLSHLEGKLTDTCSWKSFSFLVSGTTENIYSLFVIVCYNIFQLSLEKTSNENLKQDFGDSPFPFISKIWNMVTFMNMFFFSVTYCLKCYIFW